MLLDEHLLQDGVLADADEARIRHELLVEAMNELNERERQILRSAG